MAGPAEPSSVPASPIGRLLRQCRHSFLIVFWMSACLEFLKLAPMLYMMSMYDRVMSARSGVTLMSLTALILGIYIFWSSVEWLRTRLMVRISMRMDWDLAPDVYDASFRRYVSRRNVNVTQVMNDVVALRQFFAGKPILALMDAPFALMFVVVGFLFHPLLAAFIFGATIAMSVSAYLTQRVTTPALKTASEENAEAQRLAAEGLRHAEATYALGMLPAVRRRWYARHRRFLEFSVNASEASGLMGGMSQFLGRAMPSLQIALGVWLAIEGAITGGMVMAASLLIGLAVAPIRELLSSGKDIVEARMAYDRLNILLTEDKQTTSHMRLPPPTGRLDVVSAIAVPPGTNKAVVQDISFSVKPGEAVAIIGPSAAGKSSLSRLLMGIWAPARGSVRLDGVEVADWDHEELGPHVGYVPQEVALFEGTIAENIARLGEVDPDKVIEAARLIGMHESILGFPNGYDTMLGESGFALSGGQKQRIAIARAFYGSPKFIVMDEPNANLDDVGENMLIEAISSLKAQGVTFVVTTHRPRIVSVTDNLLVLRAGRQVGYGPANEMIAALRNMQAVGDQPEGNKAGSNVASMADVRSA